jgi:uncharacterized protein
MEIKGDYKYKERNVAQVWQTLMNREALKAALPGCDSLEEVEPNVFHVTITVGVASIKGTYHGRIALQDLDEPKSYKLIVGGQSANGFLHGEGLFELGENQKGDKTETVVNYVGKADIGGRLAGIGARMLSPVAKKLAGDFFKNMEKFMQEQEKQAAEAEAHPS